MAEVLIIGGGVAGLAAAGRLAEAGVEVAVVEKQPRLGGLAGSFFQDGRAFPLGYHQILEGDEPLLAVMDALGLGARIRWRPIHMAFSIDGAIHTLAGPRDALRFPLKLRTKAGLARLVAQTWLLPPDPDLADVDAETWIRRFAGEEACRAFFDPLTRLKFGLPCKELSAAWLRDRLLGREGRGRFGYLPDTDWTFALIEALAERLRGMGVAVHTGAPVTKIDARGGRIAAVHAEGLATFRPRVVISTLPPPLLIRLLPGLGAGPLGEIRYSGVISTVVGTRDAVPLRHYWTNFIRPYYRFGGIFRLDRLNPSLGAPGERILNFATHVGHRGEDSPLHLPPDALLEGYLADYEARFGARLTPSWAHTSRIPYYSPIFVKRYRNPPICMEDPSNLYLAGNFRTSPTLASTGTALASGRESAEAALRGMGREEGPASGEAWAGPPRTFDRDLDSALDFEAVSAR